MDFPLSRRGYDPAAVDAHLRELADRFEAERSEPQSLAAMGGEQVQSIVAAAESSAAEIRGEAEAAAAAAAEAARADAERVRSEAMQQAQQYVSAVRDATTAMLERVQALEAELGALVGSVRSNGERLGGKLAQLTRELGELSTSANTTVTGASPTVQLPAGRRTRSRKGDAPPRKASSG